MDPVSQPFFPPPLPDPHIHPTVQSSFLLRPSQLHPCQLWPLPALCSRYWTKPQLSAASSETLWGGSKMGWGREGAKSTKKSTAKTKQQKQSPPPQQKTKNKTERKNKNKSKKIKWGEKGKGKKKNNIKWKKEKKKKKEKCPRIKQGLTGPGVQAGWEVAWGFRKEKAAHFGWGGAHTEL